MPESRLSPETVDLFVRASTHPTWARERGGADNQRLEFLGDAVLKLLVAELLFEAMPEADEGTMSRVLHQLVDNELLAKLAREHNLGSVLRLGVGEERQGGRDRTSNLADLYEALLGAVYLDQGLDAARDVVRTTFSAHIATARTRRNPRSALQTWAERGGHGVPEYQVVEVHGPEHARRYTAEVRVGEVWQGRGVGPRKKSAFADAAAQALASIEQDVDNATEAEDECGP